MYYKCRYPPGQYVCGIRADGTITMRTMISAVYIVHEWLEWQTVEYTLKGYGDELFSESDLCDNEIAAKVELERRTRDPLDDAREHLKEMESCHRMNT